MGEVEFSGWWLALSPLVVPTVVFLFNMLVSYVAVRWHDRAEALRAAGQPASARRWERLAARAANFQVGRKPSVVPPPYGVIPTLPPPAPLPSEYRPTPAGPVIELRDTVRDRPRNHGGHR